MTSSSNIQTREGTIQASTRTNYDIKKPLTDKRKNHLHIQTMPPWNIILTRERTIFISLGLKFRRIIQTVLREKKKVCIQILLQFLDFADTITIFFFCSLKLFKSSKFSSSAWAWPWRLCPFPLVILCDIWTKLMENRAFWPHYTAALL